MQPNDQQNPVQPAAPAPENPLPQQQPVQQVEQQPVQPPVQQPPVSSVQPATPIEVGALAVDAAQYSETEQEPAVLPQAEPVQWQAPEYLVTKKAIGWYAAFGVAVILMMALAILVIKSWTFALLIPVMAAALVIYVNRPPHSSTYVVSDKGIYINEKLHPMSEFKSFGVLQESSLPAIVFTPIRRFRPALTVYFPSEAGEAIVDRLGPHLPMEAVRLDAFDKIIKALHI